MISRTRRRKRARRLFGIRLCVCVFLGVVAIAAVCSMVYRNGPAPGALADEASAVNLSPSPVAATVSMSAASFSPSPTGTAVPTGTPTPTPQATLSPTQTPVPTDNTQAISAYFEAASSNVAVDELPGDTMQLIVVRSSGSTARIRFFEKSREGVWAEDASLYTKGFVGSNGVSASKREGDKATPAGLFGIGEAFYTGDKPDTGLACFAITRDTYWVDDPASQYYNMRVEGTGDKDWSSAEPMAEYESSYKYGFVILHNADRTPGMGSAIFFHKGGKSTTGCVAVEEDILLKYLSLLDREKNPHVLIL